MENTSEETLKMEKSHAVKPKTKSFSVTNYAQLTTHGLNNIVSLFVSTFLISYIYQISNNYVLNIGLFYCSNYLVMGVAYFAISNLIDKTNRVWFYRSAIIIRASFILCVIFAGKSLASYVVLAGALHGFSEACYWTSFNIMKNELVRKSAMSRYSTCQMTIEKVVNIVVPLALGSLIDAESFKSSAIIVLIVSVLEMISSMFIYSKRPENSSFDMKDFALKTKALNEKKCLVVDCIVNGGLYGFTTLISPMVTIMIMYSYGSNLSLGILTSIFSVFSMIFLLIINKYSKTGKRNVLFILASLLPVISAILLVLNVSKVTVAIFNLVYLVLSMVHSYTYDVSRNVVLKKLGMYDAIAEFQCSIECFMEFCRFIGFGIMALIGVIFESFGTDGILLAAKIMVVVSSLSMPLINLRLLKYENKLVKFGID